MKLSKNNIIAYIPIVAIAAVLPLFAYVHIYSYSNENVALLDEKVQLSDIFSYGKCVFLWIITCIMAWRMLSDKITDKSEKREKNSKIFFVLIALGIWQIISMFFAIDKDVALWGGYLRFEGTIVLVSYLLVCFYVYKVVKQHGNIECIVNALSISSIIMSVSGFLQIAGYDLFSKNWFLKLLLPFGEKPEFEEVLKIKKAYMTLINPNTASVYLSMVIPVLFVATFKLKGYKRALASLALVIDLVMLVYTGSRVGVVALLIVGVIGAIYGRYYIRKNIKRLAIGGCLLFVILAGANISMRLFSTALSERFASTVVSDEKQDVLQVYTKDDGIHLVKSSKEYVICFNPLDEGYAKVEVKDATLKNVSDAVYSYDQGRFLDKDFEGVSIELADVNDEMFVMLKEDQEWFFTRDTNGGYLLYVGGTLYEKIDDVEKVDFGGKEAFASGRGYIWSRALPLIKKYPLFGCGADNFFLAFPQNDYNGKRKYCEGYNTVVEKAHNGYLQIAVQNGIPALVLIVLFYFAYLFKVRKQKGAIMTGMVAATFAYVIALFFNDSNVVITSLFFVFVGATLGYAEAGKKELK